MKEKTIFTKKEWKEIEEMQERAKAKRKAEEKARLTKNKKIKKDKMIGFIMMSIIALVYGLIFTPVIIEYLKVIID